MKERILLSRSYRILNTNYGLSINGDKNFDSEIVIDVVNNSGEITFTIFDSNNNEVFSLINPESNSYTFKMNKGEKYLLKIKSSKAFGSHKIKERIYKE